MAEQAVFTTPDVGRVFLTCKDCGRVKPHYHIYPNLGEPAKPRCRCGSFYFRPKQISEVVAAWWVLVVGYLWRKTILHADQWDPRMPVRNT